jgi:hypothetical protein
MKTSKNVVKGMTQELTSGVASADILLGELV